MTVTDGPFAETKELIGGFAILEAASREEAIQLGKKFMQLHIDVLGHTYEGTLEVRPMFDPTSADREHRAAFQLRIRQLFKPCRFRDRPKSRFRT